MSDSTARRLRVGELTLAVAIAACLFAPPLATADPAARDAPALARFDGIYTGTFTTISLGFANLESERAGGGQCEENKLVQQMSVSNGQVYMERKYVNPGMRLLLAGTVSADGRVSAAGVTAPQAPYRSVGARLSGTIEANDFTGQLNFRYCDFAVKLRKTR